MVAVFRESVDDRKHVRVVQNMEAKKRLGL
jgi:hypothetical protein